MRAAGGKVLSVRMRAGGRRVRMRAAGVEVLGCAWQGGEKC